MIKVFIADDHSIVREGMRSLINSAPDMQVVGEAADGDAALASLLVCKPDLFLMDMTMPGCSGLELIKVVRRRLPDTFVLVLSMHREEQYATHTIRAGAQGFITKTRPPEELLDALRQVARGQLYIPAELARKLAFQALTGQSDDHRHGRLSAREHEVFLALAQGQSVGDIASQLHVSSKTVSTHKARILAKLDVDSLSGLIRYAVSHELLSE